MLGENIMKKKLLFLTSIMICILVAFSINNTTCKAAKTVKITSIKATNIDGSNYYTMRVSGTLNIKTSISPKNATNKNITWSSSDKTIAKVSNKGVVTGVNGGFCKITGVAKDGSNKKVSFYVRVYAEKEFINSYGWHYYDGGDLCYLNLSQSGEYSRGNIPNEDELESGLYTIDVPNKTITFSMKNGSNKEVWNYTIVTRSKLILSNGTTEVTYTRDYKNKNVTCMSNGLLYVPNGTTQARITGYRGTDTTITIPSMINKRKVTYVGGIRENADIEQIIIPDSVTIVYDFKDCINLKTITIPDSVTEFYGSFENCTNLKTIKLPDSYRNLDSFSFKNCTSLETMQLPADLVAIFQGTFQGCTSLKSVELPEQVVSVGREAFWNCTSLESLFFPKGIKDIDPDILKGCNNVVIYGYKDTCAKTFAEANNLKFIER